MCIRDRFKPIGSYVVAFSNEEVETLEELKARGEENGVPGLEILDKEACLLYTSRCV